MDAESVKKAFAKELKTLPEQMTLSRTYDRKIELSEHKLFTEDTKIQVYFAILTVLGSVEQMRTRTC